MSYLHSRFRSTPNGSLALHGLAVMRAAISCQCISLRCPPRPDRRPPKNQVVHGRQASPCCSEPHARQINSKDMRAATQPANRGEYPHRPDGWYALLTCPEHIRTCPNFTVTLATPWASWTVSIVPQFTRCGGRCASHVPLMSTVALATCVPPSRSCTIDPAAPLLVPHTATRASFWSTAPPEKIDANAKVGGGDGGGPGGCGGDGAGGGPMTLPDAEQLPSIVLSVVFSRMQVHSVPPRPHARTSKATHCGRLAVHAAQHAVGVVTDVR